MSPESPRAKGRKRHSALVAEDCPKMDKHLGLGAERANHGPKTRVTCVRDIGERLGDVATLDVEGYAPSRTVCGSYLDSDRADRIPEEPARDLDAVSLRSRAGLRCVDGATDSCMRMGSLDAGYLDPGHLRYLNASTKRLSPLRLSRVVISGNELAVSW